MRAFYAVMCFIFQAETIEVSFAEDNEKIKAFLLKRLNKTLGIRVFARSLLVFEMLLKSFGLFENPSFVRIVSCRRDEDLPRFDMQEIQREQVAKPSCRDDFL